MALAALATSATVLVAALCDARPGLFFLAFGIVCFALAAMVHDQHLPAPSGPLFCMVAGVVQLVAFSAIHQAHAQDPAVGVLAPLGFGYLLLGTVAWLRMRFS